MKTTTSLPTIFSLLLTIPFTLSKVLPREPPSVEAIMADIFPRMQDDHSTFWVGQEESRVAAESFARANNHITIRDTDPDNKWKNGDDQGIENWSRAYARLSSGTAFVFYQDTTQIPEALDKYWNAERSEMEDNDLKEIFEIIQVNRGDLTDFKQIYPVDLTDEDLGIDLSQCTWTQCTTLTCPGGMNIITHSMYSDQSTDIIYRCHGEPKAENARTLCCP